MEWRSCSSLRHSFSPCLSPTFKWLSRKKEMRRRGSTRALFRKTLGSEKLLKDAEPFWSQCVEMKSLTKIYTPTRTTFRENGRNKVSWVFVRETELFPVRRDLIIPVHEYLKSHNWFSHSKPQQTLSHTIKYFLEKKKERNHERSDFWKKMCKKYNGKWISKQSPSIHGEMWFQLHLEPVCQLL